MTSSTASSKCSILVMVNLNPLLAAFSMGAMTRRGCGKINQWREGQDDGGTCNMDPQNLSVKLTRICESRSTVPRDPPRLTYECWLYTNLCQVWWDLSVFMTGSVRFRLWQYPTWISLCGDYSIESSRWNLWFQISKQVFGDLLLVQRSHFSF